MKFFGYLKFVLDVIFIQVSPLFGHVLSVSTDLYSVAFNWTKTLQFYFGYKLYRISETENEGKNNVVYLCNHRSWVDFFIDHQTTGYCSTAISRYIILFVFPLISISSLLLNQIIFFKRGDKVDNIMKKVTDFFRRKLSKRLIVYPEGTRRTSNEVCDLKKGFIYFAYDNRASVQVVISKNKENVLSEKTFTSNYGQNIFTYYGKTLSPDDHDTKEEFFGAVQEEWKRVWAFVYSGQHEVMLPNELPAPDANGEDVSVILNFIYTWFLRFGLVWMIWRLF
jgi:1-acyl-sn-glycerol-3-phosphate acyltransferase